MTTNENQRDLVDPSVKLKQKFNELQLREAEANCKRIAQSRARLERLEGQLKPEVFAQMMLAIDSAQHDLDELLKEYQSR